MITWISGCGLQCGLCLVGAGKLFFLCKKNRFCYLRGAGMQGVSSEGWPGWLPVRGGRGSEATIAAGREGRRQAVRTG